MFDFTAEFWHALFHVLFAFFCFFCFFSHLILVVISLRLFVWLLCCLIKISGFSRFVDFFVEDGCYTLVMEHGGNDFFGYVTNAFERIKNNEISLQEWQIYVRYFFHQLVRTVYFFHVICGFAHLDLSLENTVIDTTGDDYENGDPCVRIIDFGLARNSWNSHDLFKGDGYVGKKSYQAPEIRKLRKYYRKRVDIPKECRYDQRKADMWCLGVMLFMMTVGCHPWEAAESKHLSYQYAMRGRLRDVLQSWKRDSWVESMAFGMLSLHIGSLVFFLHRLYFVTDIYL